MSESPQYIHKAGAAIIIDKKLLVSRSKGKTDFVAPGGKLESGEMPTQALIRELKEEQGLDVRPEDLSLLGRYEAIAAGEEESQTHVTMDVYLVNNLSGQPTPRGEIEENKLVTSRDVGVVAMGSIVGHEVIPELVLRELID
ncbi:NUDIX domain-containing protein [Candidatus Saccharibacteria bacterium]|nr:NUDIX domain-containing protein [Candidatus Saccharibacteria bacterium]